MQRRAFVNNLFIMRPVSILSLLLAILPAAGGQLPGTNIKVDVRLVSLNVRVANRAGQPVPGLRQNDFEVFEEGVRQTVSHFQPVTAPIHLFLMLDLSGSTLAKMDIILEAAARFVDALGPEDEVAVATFARQIHVVSDFTRDRSLIKRRIRGLQNRGSRTGFYDAMWSAMDFLARVPNARKAIVVMTDGFDSSLIDPKEWASEHGFQELLARAGAEESVIYPVYLNTKSDSAIPLTRSVREAYARAYKQIEALADQTGGTVFRSRRPEDLERAYRNVAAELRTSYSLGYTPSELRRDGSWRKVAVKVDRSGLKIRTRPGYYAR